MKTVNGVKRKLSKNVDSFLEEVYPIYIKMGLTLNSPEEPEPRIPTKKFLKKTLLSMIKSVTEETIELKQCHLGVSIYESDGKIVGCMSIILEKEYK